MRSLVDILAEVPLIKLIDLHPELVPALLAERDKDKPRRVGTHYEKEGEQPIMYFLGNLAYRQRVGLGWTHARMVNEGEAEWTDARE